LQSSILRQLGHQGCAERHSQKNAALIDVKHSSELQKRRENAPRSGVRKYSKGNLPHKGSRNIGGAKKTVFSEGECFWSHIFRSILILKRTCSLVTTGERCCALLSSLRSQSSSSSHPLMPRSGSPRSVGIVFQSCLLHCENAPLLAVFDELSAACSPCLVFRFSASRPCSMGIPCMLATSAPQSRMLQLCLVLMAI
jgi:hypothetical protein